MARKPKSGQIVSQAAIVVTETVDGRLSINAGPMFPLGGTGSVASKTADSIVRTVQAIMEEHGGFKVHYAQYSEDDKGGGE